MPRTKSFSCFPLGIERSNTRDSFYIEFFWIQQTFHSSLITEKPPLHNLNAARYITTLPHRRRNNERTLFDKEL